MGNDDAIALDSSNKVFRFGEDGKYTVDFSNTNGGKTTVKFNMEGKSQSMSVIVDSSLAEQARVAMENDSSSTISSLSSALNNDFKEGDTYDFSDATTLSQVRNRIDRIGNGDFTPI